MNESNLYLSVKGEFLDVWRYRYVVYSYVHTNLRLRYRRSYLGFLWTVLAPLLNYLVIGIVFSFLMNNRIDNFFAYYFTGSIFFSVISGVLNRAPTFLIGNEHYIKKIYLPKMVFVLNGSFYEFSNFLFSLLTLILVGIFIDYIHFTPYIILSLISLVPLLFFLIGLGTIISVGTVYFRDFLHIIPSGIQALFFVTPIIYKMDLIPQKYHLLILLNPIYYFLEIFRSPLLYETIPSLRLYAIAVSISFLTFWLGVLTMKQFDNKIIFKL